MPRFSLRDLFWLTLVAAVCVAWWLDHHRQETWLRFYEQQGFSRQSGFAFPSGRTPVRSSPK